MRWGFLAYHPTLYDDAPEQSVTWVLTLFGTYVLPAMFGLLGTMAAVVRAVLAKVRDSLLGPRDLSLSLLGLVIGPLAGLAVGLFYTPSATAAQGTAGLAGTVTLTVSGLGFLAGYGADAFFKFLDALLVRVFALEDGKGGK
jgi:LytS/YehU family sensor histidine kinase